jgi:phage-related protein
MTSVESGVAELRIHTGKEYRVIYIARFAERIYVLHTFEKRSRQTRTVDLELARKRLRDLSRLRSTR